MPGLGFTQLYVMREEQAVEVSPLLPMEEWVEEKGLTISGVGVELKYYVGATSGGQNSGAYVFRCHPPHSMPHRGICLPPKT